MQSAFPSGGLPTTLQRALLVFPGLFTNGPLLLSVMAKRQVTKKTRVRRDRPTSTSPATVEVSAHAARRALLAAQGLLADPSRRATAAEVKRTIEQMGFLQVDTINVVDRAHELILASRLDRYRPTMLRKLLEDKRVMFEHWTHDASIIPLQWFHHWKPRFDRYRSRDPWRTWWQNQLGSKSSKLLKSVRQSIEQNGPMMSRQFERDKNSKGPAGKWWSWKPEKMALEFLWRTGELTIAKRINFQKVYDLTERVLPDHHALPYPGNDEHVAWACRTALERLMFATPREVAAFWAAIHLRDATAWLKRMHKAGEIDLVTVKSADDAAPKLMYVLPDWPQRLEACEAMPAPDRIRFINPFDPIIRDRDRARRLFNFDYRFEAFTPAARRKYGYYVMPLLQGDAIIGRCDAKHHRDQSLLEIKGVWWEKHSKRQGVPARVRNTQFGEACERLAAFIGAEKISRAGRT